MAIGFTRDGVGIGCGVGSGGGLAVHQRTLKDTLSLTREKKSWSHKRCFTLGKVYSVYHFLHTSSRIVGLCFALYIWNILRDTVKTDEFKNVNFQVKRLLNLTVCVAPLG